MCVIFVTFKYFQNLFRDQLIIIQPMHCTYQYEGEVLRTRIKWNILLNGKVSQFLSLLLPKNGQHSHCKCIHIQRLQSSSSKSKARRLQPVKSTLCKKGSFNSEPPAAPRIPSTATTTYHIWTSEIKSSYASTNKSA